MKKVMLFAAAAVSALCVAQSASSQNYPVRPIRILIAQAPGSTTDIVSRILGNKLGESLGQPMVIDARPGAGGTLGTDSPRVQPRMATHCPWRITRHTDPIPLCIPSWYTR